MRIKRVPSLPKVKNQRIACYIVNRDAAAAAWIVALVVRQIGDKRGYCTLSGRHRITLAADKAYDVADFIAKLRALGVTPHVAQNTTNRRSAIDGRTTRHPGYAVSQRVRKRIEEGFGWIKTYGGMRKTRHVGNPRVAWTFTLTAAACNLVRLPKLLAVA
jgi:hypothetical protein